MEIIVQITPVAEGAPKARLPRKLKKDIKKTCGAENYRAMIAQMQKCYNMIGYRKFNFKKQK